MIQHIEELGAELELDPFSDVEVLADPISKFQTPGPRKKFRGVPYCPGSGIQNELWVPLICLQLLASSPALASNTTGPSVPGTIFNFVEGFGPTKAARVT